MNSVQLATVLQSCMLLDMTLQYIQIQILYNANVFTYKYIGKYFKYFSNTFHYYDMGKRKANIYREFET